MQLALTTTEFFHSLFAISNAYMSKVRQWRDDFVPQVIHENLGADALFELQKPFDFIIVGSGYAGSLLARRLANTGCYRILIMDSGPAPSFESSIPFMRQRNLTGLTYNYMSVPQRHTGKGLNNEESRMFVPKILGGDSSIDSGTFLPINTYDFLRLSSGYSLRRWSPELMQPYMTQSFQDQSVDDYHKNSTHNVTNGATSHPRAAKTPQKKQVLRPEAIMTLSNVQLDGRMKVLTDVWLHAGKTLGYNFSNGDSSEIYEREGFFIPKLTSHNGRQMNSVSMFLRDIPPESLVVLANVEPTRILFDNDKTRAIGVEIRGPNGATYTAKATREVVLSAGAVNTAKILIQSGIGPHDHLDELEIPPVRNLPVGSTLRDRVSASLFVHIDRVYIEELKQELADMPGFLHYLQEGKGMLATPSTLAAALIKTDPKHRDADILLELRPFGLLGPKELVEHFNYRPEILELLDRTKEIFTDGGLEIRMTVLRPYSQGVMWLQKTFGPGNATNFIPVMNPSYLQDFRDAQVLVRGAVLVEELVQTDVMKQIGAKLLRPAFKDCPRWEEGPRKYWLCVMRYMGTTGSFITGTAPILSVVDEELRVQSVQGLRVVDESVFPLPLSGGMSGSLLTIANRVASSMLLSNHVQDCSNKPT